MQGAGGPQRTYSVLDRLLLTHPVWLQLSISRDSALYVLLREPVGVRPSQLFFSNPLDQSKRRGQKV